MGLIAPAVRLVNPSFIEPEAIIQINQASGAFDLLADRKPRVRLGEGDLAVYIRQVALRTKANSGQSAYNQLTSCDVVASYTGTATYLNRVRAEFDHHDTAAAANYNIALPEAQRLGMRQAHFQLLRNMLLFGNNPVFGEGLLNAPGATAVTLPADSFGNTTATTYDNGQMSFFQLGQWGAIKTRTMQLGIGHTCVVIGPQRIMEIWEYQGIVQLVQFQRIGAGTATTAGVYKMVAAENGDTVIWGYDDTLIGAGAGSTSSANVDAVIMCMPQISQPVVGDGQPDTNEFGRMPNGMYANTLQYLDMPAPREIVAPLAGGAIDITTEMRASSGWAIRPEAVTILSIPYP
jgi:hypothetical protein